MDKKSYIKCQLIQITGNKQIFTTKTLIPFFLQNPGAPCIAPTASRFDEDPDMLDMDFRDVLTNIP